MIRNQVIKSMIIKWEGGYSNRPTDKGGPTNFGITQADLAEWYGRQVSASDVRQMDIDTAISIYRKNYWDRAKIYLLPPALWAVVFDAGVNNGINTATKFLQRVISANGIDVVVDCHMGPATATATFKLLAKIGAKAAVNAYCDIRVAYYHDIVDNKPDQREYINGWLRRANSYRVA